MKKTSFLQAAFPQWFAGWHSCPTFSVRQVGAEEAVSSSTSDAAALTEKSTVSDTSVARSSRALLQTQEEVKGSTYRDSGKGR